MRSAELDKLGIDTVPSGAWDAAVEGDVAMLKEIKTSAVAQAVQYEQQIAALYRQLEEAQKDHERVSGIIQFCNKATELLEE